MATQALGLLSFNGGEWSPLVYARADIPKYIVGARRLENFIPLVEGPITRRPGFRHVAPVRTNEDDVRFMPFVFSADQTYVIEATPLKFRFYRNRAPVVEAAVAITGITKANPAVVTAPGHGYQNGDEVLIDSVAGMTQVNNRRFKVANKATNTFQITDLDGVNVNSTGYTTYSSSGAVRRVYELTTTYAAADLPLLSFDQSKDVLYIGCPGKKPRKLTRLGDTNWTLADETFVDGPYLPENGTDTRVTISPDGGSAGASVTLTFSSTRGINGGAGFTSNDIGRLVRCLRRDTASTSPSYQTWAWFQITSVSTSRIVVATAKSDVGYEFGATKLHTRWRLGMWSDNMGWPSKVAIFQGRAWWAATNTYPLNVWASQSDVYESFAPTSLTIPVSETAPTPTPADAFTLSLGGGQANLLRWLLPLTYLTVGSAGDERSIRGSDLDEVVAFDNAVNRLASNVGCHDALPVRVNSSGMFISKDQRALHELAYTTQIDNYTSPNLSQYAKHIGQESKLVELAWQRRPWSICWARRADGTLVGLTYEREQEVVAWHRHPLGGTAAKALALTCIPGDGQDELWLVVERTINGQARRHVEVMTYEQPMGQADARNFCHLDASLSYDGSAVTTLNGLEHLVGETVKVLADGALHADVVVQAPGTITLTRSASVVHVGYGYTSKAIPLPLEYGNPAGAGLGRPKGVFHLTLLLVETIGGKVGPRESLTEEIKIRRVGDQSNSPPALATERRRLNWPGGVQETLEMVILQDLPFPMTLAGAVPGYAINEG